MIDRRTFLLQAGAAVVPLSFCSGARRATAEEKPIMNPIGLHNEWGKLREVIVGVLPEDSVVPTPTHFCYQVPQGPTHAGAVSAVPGETIEGHRARPTRRDRRPARRLG